MSNDFSNSERFLEAFNQIEQELNNRFRPGFHVGFSELIRRMQSQDTVVKRFSTDLREYAELRNAIVHNRRENFVIAEPHNDVVNEICRIRNLILNPPTISVLQHRNVFTATRQMTIREVLSAFGREGFSRCPVTEGRIITGLITARAIARWLSATVNETDGLKEATVDSVFPWAEKEKFAVVHPRTRLHDVYELFKAQLRGGGSLQAVLITRSGRPEIPVEGIITASDLPGIFSLIDKS